MSGVAHARSGEVAFGRCPGESLSLAARNLRIASKEGGRRLFFTFEAGTPAEQATIINAFLRSTFSSHERTLKWGEECLRRSEKLMPLDAEICKWEAFNYLKRPQKELEAAKVAEAELRTAIARLKQYVVVKWAK